MCPASRPRQGHAERPSPVSISFHHRPLVARPCLESPSRPAHTLDRHGARFYASRTSSSASPFTAIAASPPKPLKLAFSPKSATSTTKPPSNATSTPSGIPAISKTSASSANKPPKAGSFTSTSKSAPPSARSTTPASTQFPPATSSTVSKIAKSDSPSRTNTIPPRSKRPKSS